MEQVEEGYQMKVSEILYGAADRLERDGWAQQEGPFVGTDPTCAGNAIGRVGGIGSVAGIDAQVAFARYVSDGDSDRLRAIFGWNDTPGRTAHEVTAALRACAVIQAARESSPAPALAEAVA